MSSASARCPRRALRRTLRRTRRSTGTQAIRINIHTMVNTRSRSRLAMHRLRSWETIANAPPRLQTYHSVIVRSRMRNTYLAPLENMTEPRAIARHLRWFTIVPKTYSFLRDGLVEMSPMLAGFTLNW